MPPAAAVVARPNLMGTVLMPTSSSTTTTTPIHPKDALIGWFRGEFAAANAIIDSLCGHLVQLEGGGSEYDSVFAAIHQRRLNWIPILHMQKYCSIADVALELRKVEAKKAAEEKKLSAEKAEMIQINKKENKNSSEMSIVAGEKTIPEDSENGNGGNGEVVDEDSAKDDSPESEITDTGTYSILIILPPFYLFKIKYLNFVF